MARKLRIQYPGACYHIQNRGHRGEAIVRDDVDRECFLRTLGEACVKTGWKVHAYALLVDHFHLVVETPEANLVVGMKWFLGTYTARFNRRHSVSGHLFTGRYRSQLMDPSAAGGSRALAATYLHLNPLRKGDIGAVADLAAFQWTSFPSYLQTADKRPAWLCVSDVFAELGLADDAAGRAAFSQYTQAEHARFDAARLKQFRSGWYQGSEVFRRELLERLEGQRRPDSAGQIWKESAALQAERILQRQLEALGWDEQEVARRGKTDPNKMRMARLLRQDTTMTIQWIADRLHMGTRNTLRNALATPEATDVFRKTRVNKPQKAAQTRVQGAPLSENPFIPPAPPSPSQSFSVEPGWD